MSFLNVILCFSLSVFTILAHESDVFTVKYTVDNFSEELPKKHHFVMFYAPWCGHCSRLAPTWEQLAEMLNEDDSNIRIAKVDCTSDSKICSEQDVTGYPTLKFFKVGDNEGVKFRGTRDMPTLTNFINEQLRQGDEIDGTVNIVHESPLKELTGENFDSLTEKGKHFVKFYAPWCGHCQKLAPVWEDLAKAMEFNEEINIAKIDCTIHRQVCNNFDVRGYPTLLWIEDGKKIDKFQGERTLENLKNYVNKMAGTVPEKKEEPPKENIEQEEVSILELNADNFGEGVKSGLTFVEFFSPWCGHCKRLAPTWENLGKKFHKYGGVTIAKVDCTADGNREFCNQQEIEGFPSLFLYKDGEKISEYSGSRSLEDLFDFVNQHLVHDEL
ncbi:thioredoxin domain-containing protein 5 homolog [Cylas formicarius]|uniref:thioredoxin domain-containing protein 5 homolog n=1 Tax=Cylas formicarius TaxID=197179 RepID=UPI0029583A54|nr:thioredoxin domain-containing protein 5 homolog [Cylas formicarius]